MRSTRQSDFATRRDVPSSIFFLLLTLMVAILAIPTLAHAAPDDIDPDRATEEYDVKDRVARVSFITGEVKLKRAGNADWERVRPNFPLVEGDTISTEDDSRVEIQIDARNFIRLGANSILRIAALRDQGVALSVMQGTATVRLARLDRDQEYFEIDAPKTTLAAETTGLYRIDVSREGGVRLTARDGGRARIYSETSGFALRDGRTAELVLEGANAGDWEFVTASTDLWDGWVSERERFLAERMQYDTQYYDQYTWGAEDLDSYGDWVHTPDYGWIWRPDASSINYGDWAPYRYGGWVWVAPYGWTWVGNEPWGWAPYHYGRWVYYNGYWAWCPRSYYYGNRGWWRPALVAFVYSSGDNYCWYPLHYHQRDHKRRHHGRNNNNPDSGRLRPMRSTELANLERVNPAQLRAVSAMSARDLGTEGARPRAADPALARRVANGEPAQTDLPARAARAATDQGTRAGATSGAARPARVGSDVGRDLGLLLPTGAAPRSPGVALDEELRRSRVLNGRQPRPARVDSPVPTGVGGVEGIESRPTGAVERPARSTSERERRIDSTQTPVRIPTNDDSTPVDRPARTGGSERPARIDQPDQSERPVRTERQEQPGRVERRDVPPVQYEQPKREEPAPRSDPPPRSEAPTQRYEPPPRNDPPPRSEAPTQRYEPTPRNDPPPQRSEPPARSDPPPQRSEPPARSDPPPQRSDPPPQRSEPSRTDTDRPSRKGDPR